MYVMLQENIEHHKHIILSKAKSYCCLDNGNSIVRNTLDHNYIVSDTLDHPLQRY